MDQPMTATPRVTTADVDQRVASLEGSVAKVETRLAVVELEQSHLRELMQSGFTAVGAKLDAVLAHQSSAEEKRRADHGRYDAFIARLEGRGDMLKWIAGTSAIGFLATLAALLKALGVF